MKRVVPWALFIAFSFATFFIWRASQVRDYLAWDFNSLVRLVTVMGLICLALGIYLARKERYRVLPTGVVAVGLIVGQSWFLELVWFWFTWHVLGGGP